MTPLTSPERRPSSPLRLDDIAMSEFLDIAQHPRRLPFLAV